MSQYFIYAEDKDGLDDYSETIVVYSELPLPQVLANIEKAAKEDFARNGNMSPSGYDGGTNWHDITNLDSGICAKYGFRVESMAFDHIVDANDFLVLGDIWN